MARLLDWPLGLGISRVEPIAGPLAIGAQSADRATLGGFVQTITSPFGFWTFQASLHPVQARLERRMEGWLTAMHGGANATRLTWSHTGQNVPFDDAGYPALSAQTWSNGQRFGEGTLWRPSLPVIDAPALAENATLLTLPASEWGQRLGMGDYFGFGPLHFGVYKITETFAGGKYRFWPPLRKAVTTGDFVTLEPVLAVRLVGMTGLSGRAKVPGYREGAQLTLIEVPDYHVRLYFTE
ncbi:hypothetical protein [Oceaniradius stylonematis]|uniref:hypothetical protein n=1 Tax=Oceaniradius stylonematis TaxID=2184161 RepID=UPI00273DCD1E|nr:hypothetical protein [Oceaniradius stylonematis]